MKLQDMVDGIAPYRLTSPTKNNDDWTPSRSRLLDGKPIIKTSMKPGEIFADVFKVVPGTLHSHPTYQALAGHLAKHYKGKLPWDDFAKSIPDEMRDILRKAEIELKRHGYLICSADYKEGQARIRYAQITDVEHTKKIPEPMIPDLCTLCERDCSRKDFNGVMRQGVKPCWKQ